MNNSFGNPFDKNHAVSPDKPGRHAPKQSVAARRGGVTVNAVG